MVSLVVYFLILAGVLPRLNDAVADDSSPSPTNVRLLPVKGDFVLASFHGDVHCRSAPGSYSLKSISLNQCSTTTADSSIKYKCKQSPTRLTVTGTEYSDALCRTSKPVAEGTFHAHRCGANEGSFASAPFVSMSCGAASVMLGKEQVVLQAWGSAQCSQASNRFSNTWAPDSSIKETRGYFLQVCAAAPNSLYRYTLTYRSGDGTTLPLVLLQTFFSIKDKNCQGTHLRSPTLVKFHVPAAGQCLPDPLRPGAGWYSLVVYAKSLNALPAWVQTMTPTFSPSAMPTAIPTVLPTAVPTELPTALPTSVPTSATAVPTALPTTSLTAAPSTLSPTSMPTTRIITSSVFYSGTSTALVAGAASGTVVGTVFLPSKFQWSFDFYLNAATADDFAGVAKIAGSGCSQTPMTVEYYVGMTPTSLKVSNNGVTTSNLPSIPLATWVTVTMTVDMTLKVSTIGWTNAGTGAVLQATTTLSAMTSTAMAANTVCSGMTVYTGGDTVANGNIRNIAISDLSATAGTPVGTLKSVFTTTFDGIYNVGGNSLGEIYFAQYGSVATSPYTSFVTKVNPGGTVLSKVATTKVFTLPWAADCDRSTGTRAGICYVGEVYGHKVTAVTSSGSTYTVGATHDSSATGTAASFSYPAGIAVDKNGVVYVADNGNAKIKKISWSSSADTAGTTSTICSTVTDIAAVSVDYKLNLWAVSRSANKVVRFEKACATNSVGTDIGVGTFGIILQTTLDETGNLYVADQSGKVWRVDATSGAIVSLRFADGATVSSCTGVWYSLDRKLYISDNTAKVLKVFTPLDDTSLSPTLAGPYYPLSSYPTGQILTSTSSLGSIGTLPSGYTLSFRYKWVAAYASTDFEILTLASDQYRSTGAGYYSHAGGMAPSFYYYAGSHDLYLNNLGSSGSETKGGLTTLPKATWMTITMRVDLENRLSTCTVTPDSASPIACASNTLASGYASGFTNAFIAINRNGLAADASTTKGLLSDIYVWASWQAPDPTAAPTRVPTGQPTRQPTGQPTRQPTRQPTGQPTRQPTGQPTRQPSRQPTGQPTKVYLQGESSAYIDASSNQTWYDRQASGSRYMLRFTNGQLLILGPRQGVEGAMILQRYNFRQSDFNSGTTCTSTSAWNKYQMRPAQTDGNFAVYCGDATPTARWKLGTYNSGATYTMTLNADSYGCFWTGKSNSDGPSQSFWNTGPATSWTYRAGYVLWCPASAYTYPRALLTVAASESTGKICIPASLFSTWYLPSNSYNHLVYDIDGFKVYSGHADAASSATDNFKQGTVLWNSDWLGISKTTSCSTASPCTTTKAYKNSLCLQTDGNIVVYTNGQFMSTSYNDWRLTGTEVYTWGRNIYGGSDSRGYSLYMDSSGCLFIGATASTARYSNAFSTLYQPTGVTCQT